MTALTRHHLHDVVDPLTECLSQARRPLALLLGAGCPMSVSNDDGSPLIPSIDELTKRISESMALTDRSDDFDLLVNGLRVDTPGNAPNIESILSRLRALELVAGAEKVRQLGVIAIQEIERLITDSIARAVEVPLPRCATPYDDVAGWIGGVDRTSPVHVFTTNYDTLAEVALERNSVPYFDGFVGSSEPFLDLRTIELDELPTRWARVWKLHGSTNWALLPSGRVVRRSPNSAEERRLVHPSHLKYNESRRMPYLLMQDQLRDFLRLPSATIVTLGYSFGDEHINEVLRYGLNANPRAIVFTLQYGSIECCGSLARLALENPSLMVAARDGAVIGGRQGAWQEGPDGSPTEFDLGDFARFGAHLRRLTTRRIDTIEPNAN